MIPNLKVAVRIKLNNVSKTPRILHFLKSVASLLLLCTLLLSFATIYFCLHLDVPSLK